MKIGVNDRNVVDIVHALKRFFALDIKVTVYVVFDLAVVRLCCYYSPCSFCGICSAHFYFCSCSSAIIVFSGLLVVFKDIVINSNDILNNTNSRQEQHTHILS
jgi:hypothetical protein